MAEGLRNNGIDDELFAGRFAPDERKPVATEKPVDPSLRFMVDTIKTVAKKVGVSPKEFLLNPQVYVTVIETYLHEVRVLHERVVGALLKENAGSEEKPLSDSQNIETLAKAS